MRRTSSAMAFLFDEFIGLGRVALTGTTGITFDHAVNLSWRDHLRRAPTASQGGADGGDIEGPLDRAQSGCPRIGGAGNLAAPELFGTLTAIPYLFLARKYGSEIGYFRCARTGRLRLHPPAVRCEG